MQPDPLAPQPYILPVQDTVVVILGGGKGTRLHPLTESRSKPAVPIGGKFRIVDIPISNCIHSNFTKIFVLTQYLSASLNRHINLAFKFDTFSSGFVEVMAAEQTESSESWFEGTADAVRRQMRHFERWHPRYYLILSGDQIYRMDYRHLLAHHIQKEADVTISVIPVEREQATSFGLLKISESGRITDFVEKPKEPEVLARYRITPEAAAKLKREPGKEEYLASMGIYLFSAQAITDLVKTTEHFDFGKHVIPAAIKAQRVQSYVFDGYWEDIGTVRAYYEANLMLARPDPKFDLFDRTAPIYTNVRHLPPAMLYGARVSGCLISEGSIIQESEICESVIGVRSIIGRGASVTRTVMVGADHYDTPEIRASTGHTGAPALGVGEGTVIRNAILDKNVRIGKNVRIENRKGLDHADGDGYGIREGIVIVKKNAILADGTVI